MPKLLNTKMFGLRSPDIKFVLELGRLRASETQQYAILKTSVFLYDSHVVVCRQMPITPRVRSSQ